MAPIHDACMSGDLPKVKALINENRSNVNLKHDFDQTPLHCASRRGFHDIVQLLIDEGGDINAETGIGWTALHWAAMGGHVVVAHTLIRNGASINHKHGGGWTPLHCACHNYHMDMVKAVTSYDNCDISITNNDGETALTFAQHHGQNNEIAKLLSSSQRQEQSSDLNATGQIRHNESHSDTPTAARRQNVVTTMDTKNQSNKTKDVLVDKKLSKIPNAPTTYEEHTILSPVLADMHISDPNDVLIDQTLYRIAGGIGNEQTGLGVLLGITMAEVTQIRRDQPVHRDATMQILTTWRDDSGHLSEREKIRKLKSVLEELGKRGLVRFID